MRPFFSFFSFFYRRSPLSRTSAGGNSLVPRGPACAVGSTAGALMTGERERSREEQREAGRKLMRKMDRENVWGKERERVPQASCDPWSGTPRDAGAEFSTRMSASGLSSTKAGSCWASAAPRRTGWMEEQTNRAEKSRQPTWRRSWWRASRLTHTRVNLLERWYALTRVANHNSSSKLIVVGFLTFKCHKKIF